MLFTIGTHPEEPKSFSNTAILHTSLRKARIIIVIILYKIRLFLIPKF